MGSSGSPAPERTRYRRGKVSPNTGQRGKRALSIVMQPNRILFPKGILVSNKITVSGMENQLRYGVSDLPLLGVRRMAFTTNLGVQRIIPNKWDLPTLDRPYFYRRQPFTRYDASFVGMSREEAQAHFDKDKKKANRSKEQMRALWERWSHYDKYLQHAEAQHYHAIFTRRQWDGQKVSAGLYDLLKQSPFMVVSTQSYNRTFLQKYTFGITIGI